MPTLPLLPDLFQLYFWRGLGLGGGLEFGGGALAGLVDRLALLTLLLDRAHLQGGTQVLLGVAPDQTAIGTESFEG